MARSAGLLAEVVGVSWIGVLILLANSLVLLAFFKGARAFRTITNYFIINLAVCDLLVGCISVPFWVCVRLDLTDPRAPIYEYLISLDILFGTASIMSLTAISLERLFAVRWPARHYNLSKKPVLAVIVGTWIIGLLFTGLSFSLQTPEDQRRFTLLLLVLAFFIPFAVIVASYVGVFYTAKNMMKSANQKQLSREIHVAKTISVIIGLFIFCWVPFIVCNIFFYVNPETLRKNRWMLYLSKAMHYSNSMMNFFVYAARNEDFRHAFKVLICNKCSALPLRDARLSIDSGILLRVSDGINKSSNIARSSINGNNGIGESLLPAEDWNFSESRTKMDSKDAL